MYKVLIADDDVEILEFVSNLIAWEEHGFEICDKARNGDEALEIMKNKAVDILLTDITMPGGGGLELIAMAKEYNSHFKSLILTCHEDFVFAQTAVRLGVCEYLIKYTLEGEQLLKAMLETKAKIEEETKSREQMAVMTKTMEKSRMMLTEKWLDNLLQKDTVSVPELQRIRQEMNLQTNKIQAAIFFIRDWEVVQKRLPIQEKSLLLYAMQNIITELLAVQSYSLPYCCENEELVVFFADTPTQQQVKRTFKHIAEQIHHFLKIEISVVISLPNYEINEFAAMMRRLKRDRIHHFYPEQSPVIFEGDVPVGGQTKLADTFQMLVQVDAGRLPELRQEIDAAFEAFRENKTAAAVVAAYYQDLVRGIEEYLYRKGIGKTWTYRKADSWMGYYELAGQVTEWFEEQLRQGMTGEVRSEIKKIMNYMENHLQEKITCENMANRLNMNVSYFSKLFKKETNESFSEYLIKIRIDRATLLLLHSDLTIEAITECVGLANIHYFYRLYKKRTGKSPGEVRNRR